MNDAGRMPYDVYLPPDSEKPNFTKDTRVDFGNSHSYIYHSESGIYCSAAPPSCICPPAAKDLVWTEVVVLAVILLFAFMFMRMVFSKV